MCPGLIQASCVRLVLQYTKTEVRQQLHFALHRHRQPTGRPKTPDVYADMESMKTHYDFSDYPKDHPLFSEQNKKVIGKFKDECSGTPIAEYVGLRPKMYSILRADEQLIKEAKSVKKYVTTKQINFANYKDALFNQKT